MLELIRQPWPWYVAGPLIAFVMFLMLMFGKSFGVSANLRTICSACGAGKSVKFFDFDWKRQTWNLLFVVGAMLGGFVSQQWLTESTHVAISSQTVEDLRQLGVTDFSGYIPADVFSLEAIFTLKGFIMIIVGGFLIGFGARWAGGCTSGHAISGLSNLQIPSLLAVVGFFIGGLLMTHVLLPFLMAL